MKRKNKKIAIVLAMLTLIGLTFVYDSILSGILLTILFGGGYWVYTELTNFLKIFK